MAAAVGQFGRRVTWLPAALFVVAVPVFLVTASVSWAFNNPGIYEDGFEKYRISRVSGIAEADLSQVAAELRGYFNSRDGPLNVRTRIFGTEQALFNSREVAHMEDVKDLVWGVYFLAAASAVGLIALTLWGFLRQRRRFLDVLARRAVWGGGLTLGLLIVFGLLATVGFDSLFLKFHQLSFANDFWKLDPRNDYLVLLFPRDFWFDATMWVAVRAIAGALLVTVAGTAWTAYRKWSALRHELPG